MANVLKSNGAYNGSMPLGNHRSTGYTPEEIYDEILAEVTADGGVDNNPDLTLETITFLQEGGYLGLLGGFWSPDMFVKTTGGLVDRWYSLDGGVDMVGVALGGGGAKPAEATDANGHKVALVGVDGARVGGIMVTETAIKIVHSADQWGGWHSVQSDNADGRTMVTAFGNETAASAGYATVLGRTPLAGTAQTNWAVQLAGYDPAAAPNAAHRALGNGARGATDRVCSSLLLNVANGEVALYGNGALLNSYDAPAGGALFDYSTYERKLRSGTYYDGGANVISSRFGTQGAIAALKWAPKEKHLALAAFLNDVAARVYE